MIESVPFQKIKQQANQYDNQLVCTDPRFQRTVKIVHEDGSIFLFHRAFLMTKDNWLIVFSEHHGVHVYDCDDLVDYLEYAAHYSVSTVEQLP